MKKLLLFVICSIFYCSYAQLPPNSFGEDFTLTDINGNEFNLHETLDEGKTVILDLFATWCGPCWTFAEGGVLEELQEAYPDDVVCVAVEADPSTSPNTLTNSDLGDWTSVISYLLMDDPSGNVANDYELAYYPTIYMICEDRMVTEVEQLNSVNQYMSFINQCGSAQYSKDARVIGYNGDATYCDGDLDAGSVRIQNNGTGPLTSCNVLAKADNDVLATIPWSGNLDTYEEDWVYVGNLSGIPNNADITFEVSLSGDGDMNNNTIDPDVIGSSESSIYVTLSILTDNYPDETSWQLFDSNGNVVESTDIVGQAYGEAGDYSGQGNTEITVDWTLSPGCYIFRVYDAFGDGLNSSQWGGTDGLVQLIDATSGTVFFSSWDFGATATSAFNAGALSSIDEISDNEISIFPNPSRDYTNLSINTNTSKDINIDIYNNIGKIVYSHKAVLSTGKNNIKIYSEDLNPGQYYMNVMLDGKNTIHPLTIIE